MKHQNISVIFPLEYFRRFKNVGPSVLSFLLEKKKHGHLAITICNVKMGKASQCLFQAVNYPHFTNGKIYASINDLLTSLCQKGDQSQGFLS